MTAKSTEGDGLAAALDTLAEAVRSLPGCKGVDLLRDIADADRFMFIEKWQSVEAHKTAGALLSRGALAPVMAALAQSPEAGYLEYLNAT